MVSKLSLHVRQESKRISVHPLNPAKGGEMEQGRKKEERTERKEEDKD